MPLGLAVLGQEVAGSNLILIARGIPVAILPKRAHPAVLDPNNPANHLPISCEEVIIPDDTQSFTVSIDRASLTATAADVLKCRCEISVDGGETWQLLVAFRTWGGVRGPFSSASPNLIPSGKNRRVRTVLIPFEDIDTDVKILCG